VVATLIKALDNSKVDSTSKMMSSSISISYKTAPLKVMKPILMAPVLSFSEAQS